MNAPIKPKSPITRDVKSSTKRRLDFSTIGVIHTEDEDGEPEVTSRYRSLSDSSAVIKKKINKDLLWVHLAKLVMERND